MKSGEYEDLKNVNLFEIARFFFNLIFYFNYLKYWKNKLIKNLNVVTFRWIRYIWNNKKKNIYHFKKTFCQCILLLRAVFTKKIVTLELFQYQFWKIKFGSKIKNISYVFFYNIFIAINHKYLIAKINNILNRLKVLSLKVHDQHSLILSNVKHFLSL